MTATESDRESFLRAVVRNPADDTARLVYADWLQEHGEDERAELIRVQCEVTNLMLPAAIVARAEDDARRGVLAAREYALVATSPEWLPVCPECKGTGNINYGLADGTCGTCNGTGRVGAFVRGFPVCRVPLSACGDEIRTREQVRAAQRSVYGCCDRHADNSACDCMAKATVAPEPVWRPSSWAIAAVRAGARLEVSDREPHHVNYPASSHTAETNFYRWWCYRNPAEALDEHRPALLPESLYEPLRRLMPFSTAELAQDALNDLVNTLTADAAFGKEQP